MKGKHMPLKQFEALRLLLAGRLSRGRGIDIGISCSSGSRAQGILGLQDSSQNSIVVHQLNSSASPRFLSARDERYLLKETVENVAKNSRVFTPCNWKSSSWAESGFAVSSLLGTILLGASITSTTGYATCESNNVLPEDSKSGPEKTEADGKPSEAVTDPTSNSHTARWRVFTDMGRDLFSQGRIEEAEKYFVRALAEARAGFGEDDPHVASSCNNLAELYRLQKDYARAEPLFAEAIWRLEKAFGPNHQSVGLALHNLGAVYLLQRNFDKAGECYARALEVKGRMMGTSHPEYANTLFHLAEVRRQQGRTEESAQLLAQSVTILEDGGLGYSEAALRRMARLAELHMHLGETKEAERLNRKVLHAMEVTQGPDAPGTVAAADSLARCLQARGNLNEAKELLDRCLATRQRTLGAGHVQVSITLARLASLAVAKAEAELARGKAPEALIQFKVAVELLQRAVLIAEANFAHVEVGRPASGPKWGGGKYPGAAQALEKAVTIRPRFLSLVQSLTDLGVANLRLSQMSDLPQGERLKASEAAEAAFKRCLAVLSMPGLPPAVSASEEFRSMDATCRRHMAEILGDKKAAASSRKSKD